MKTMLYCGAAAMCFAAADDKGGAAAKPAPTAVEAAAKTVTPRGAVAISEAAPAAPTEPPETLPAAHTDVAAANAEIDDLRAQLIKARAQAEQEGAGLRSEIQTLTDAHDSLKAKIIGGALSTTEADLAEAALAGDDDPADLVEIRVKTPMLVNPIPSRWYDPARDGMLPAAFPLVRGLNLAPRWVADMAFVRANFEDDFSLDA